MRDFLCPVCTGFLLKRSGDSVTASAYCQRIHCRYWATPHDHRYTPVTKAWQGLGFFWVVDASRLDRFIVQERREEIAI